LHTIDSLPTFGQVEKARSRIGALVHRTPVLRSATIDGVANAQLFFKCENLQRCGAFKVRGAFNALLELSADQAGRGVVTHSSGNHGAALALAASTCGVRARVVVPRNAVPEKVENIRRFGAEIAFCEPTLADREATAARLVDETGSAFIHSYDNPNVIAGQGTAALELLEQHPGLDVIIAPIGGGGLLSGTAIAAKGKGTYSVMGAEPRLADDALRSLRAGRLLEAGASKTIADGLRTSLCPRTFACLSEHLDDVLTVQEQSIINAMRLIWSIMKIVVEPSAAVPLAAILENPLHPLISGRRIGVILTGGNVDLEHIPWTLR
jgi:threonine dehydratase